MSPEARIFLSSGVIPTITVIDRHSDTEWGTHEGHIRNNIGGNDSDIIRKLS